MARAAFLVPAGSDLRGEFNIINPGRDRRSDGWVGDARHAATISDHNPRDDGSVLALDVDVDGVPMARIVAFIIDRCRRGVETRLQYVIYRRTIWSRSWGWTPRRYHGSNPHTLHAHFSFRDGAPGRTPGTWGIAERFGPHAVKPTSPRPRPAGAGRPAVKHPAGSRRLMLRSPVLSGADVAHVQRWIGPEWCGPADGKYGPATVAGVKRYQRMRRSIDPSLAVDGIVGRNTWRHLGVKWTGGKT